MWNAKSDMCCPNNPSRLSRVQPFFRYMRIMFDARQKLKPYTANYLVRGVKHDLCADPFKYAVRPRLILAPIPPPHHPTTTLVPTRCCCHA